MHTITYIAIFVTISLIQAQDIALFECPTGWADFSAFCYKFDIENTGSLAFAKERCQLDGAYLVSINSQEEHSFIASELEVVDGGQQRHDWWTSGRRTSSGSMEFYWEGDGQAIESFIYWHSDVDLEDSQSLGLDMILYNHNDYEWGWILGTGYEMNPFICKISKEDVYKILDDERGPGYGVLSEDEADILHGPIMLSQPKDVVFEPLENVNIGVDQTSLECIADANPLPAYSWYKTRAGVTQVIDPTSDERYTFINGQLIIESPSTDRQDDGAYQCIVTNEYGSILSDLVYLEFGFLDDFPKSLRSPVTAESFKWAMIECSPPAHYPEILYSWYKNSPSNFIRTELKPYIFISNNGVLYFSEVTTDDVGNYYCTVNKPGVTWSSGAESMPTYLNVREGSPGVYEPQFGADFPYIYPTNPKVGDTVRLECWASGTSQPEALVYSWDKVVLDANDAVTEVLSLPLQATLSDHNRVVTIPDINLYDQGVFRCHCTRPYGDSKSKTILLQLNAEPFFTLEIGDKYVDAGATLTWKCEAGGGNIAYRWLKNAEPLVDQILPEDINRVVITQNVLTITDLTADKDNGMYQCEAKNTNGVHYSSGQLAVLSFAPTFAKYPLLPNQFATVTGNTTIYCRPEAAPAPDIVWFKNGAALNPGTTEASRLRQLPNGNLFISPVQSGDTGVYKCVATNLLGEASSQGNLTVLDSVTITYPPQTIAIAVNKTNFLHCIASYNPKLDVTYSWYQGDILVYFELIFRTGENTFDVWYNPHYKRGKGHYNGGIYIMNAQQEHMGRYTCVVESPVGDKITAYADVSVVGPPSEVAGVYIDVSSITTTAVIIQWKSAGNNGGPILSYVIETFNFWEGRWRIHKTNVWTDPDTLGTYRYNVTDLRPYSNYQIRVRAENQYGTSEPSSPTESFWTLSIKPDLYPEQLGGGGGKVGDLVITWKPLEPWQENGLGFGYRVFWKEFGDVEFAENPVLLMGSQARAVILVGEDNFYRQYEVAIQPFNELGDGPISPSVIVRSAMALPTAIATNVRSQPFNSTACKVTWEPVEDNRQYIKGKLGGYRLAYWEEYLGPDYENPWRVTLNGQMSEGLVIGLDPNTQYYFAVYVWNEAGNGPKSQWFLQRTLRNAPMNQPVEVRVFKKSDSKIRVTFRGVSTTQIEEPLEGYKVRLWRDGSDIKDASTDYNSDKDTDIEIGDLNPKITYKLRVFGYSRGGEGAMSSPAVVFMLAHGNSVKGSIFLLLGTLLLTFIISRRPLSHTL